MNTFGFGQPDGAIVQMAYKVGNIDRAVADYTARLGVGPWFVMGPFTPPGARYRGEPCLFKVTLAFAFSGGVQIELLQQHDDAPSTLRDSAEGFHHWGVGTRDFDREVARYQALGHAVIFEDVAPDGGRFAYLETTGSLPGFVELIEMVPDRDAQFTMMHQASLDWDGADPIRRMGPV